MTLLFSDVDRLAKLVNDPDRPIQLLFAGKAHPKDEPGKRFIQHVANVRHDKRFAGKVAFIEDYDINVARHLVQGVDVWLNTPQRPLEASGTSSISDSFIAAQPRKLDASKPNPSSKLSSVNCSIG